MMIGISFRQFISWCTVDVFRSQIVLFNLNLKLQILLYQNPRCWCSQKEDNDHTYDFNDGCKYDDDNDDDGGDYNYEHH